MMDAAALLTYLTIENNTRQALLRGEITDREAHHRMNNAKHVLEWIIEDHKRQPTTEKGE